MKIHDLIVIGAGPAGSTAARAAALRGLDVLIIDRESFPRDKPCGGGLSAAALRALEFPLPSDLIEQNCMGMRSLYHGREHITMDKTSVAHMIDRKNFDHFLLEKALESGARFLKRKGRKVREADGLVEIETDNDKLLARYCIGAGGYFCPAARFVHGRFTPEETRFCLVSREETIEHPIFREHESLVELDFGYIKKGYGWLFPKRGYISAGIGGEMTSTSRLKELYGSFLKTHKIPADVKVKGCFIPVSPMKKKVNTKKILLAGDAAGVVDAFSGEGIRNALLSGKIAGETAADALESGNRAVSSYRKKLNRLMGSDLRWSERISRLTYRFESIVFGILLTEDKVMLRYFEVMRGNRSYRSFFFTTVLALPYIILHKRSSE